MEFCKRALVTGATGFIGGRLVEKLILEHRVGVRCLVRNFSRASRIARFDLEMVFGSLQDQESVRKAIEGCDVVFHVAYDFLDDLEESMRVNLTGTKNILQAVEEFGCRMVHVSTVEVYGWPAEGILNEEKERKPCPSVYGSTKLAVENLVIQHQKSRHLSISIIQPTVVFGPFAPSWTHDPVKQLKKGKIVLVNGGTGCCNAVYIDDVVDSLILAACRKEAIGESFLISGSTPIRWADFYSAFERVLGVHGTRSLSVEEIETLRKEQERQPGSFRRLKDLLTDSRTHRKLLTIPIVKWASDLFFPGYSEKLERELSKTRQNSTPSITLPQEALVRLYSSQACVSIDKAMRLLGYHPNFTFETGMKLTAQYIHWANLVSQPIKRKKR